MLPLLVITLHSLLLSFATEVASASMALPGCAEKCGNLTIPYPLGTVDGCSMDEGFLLSCNSTFQPPRLFLRTPANAQYQVIDTTLDYLTIFYTDITRHCSGQDSSVTNFNLSGLPYTLSSDRNRITVVGCDSMGLFAVGDSGSFASCSSYCSNTSVIPNGTCSGEGCCQSPVKKGAKDLRIVLGSIWQYTTTRNISNCSAAFPAQKGWYSFSTADLASFEIAEVPVVLDWAVGNESCEFAKRSEGYLCVGGEGKTKCVDSESVNGYRCLCKKGYEGNPYLRDGCHDINECKQKENNPCSHGCINTEGSFKCTCPKGTYGDGLKDGKGCIKKQKFPTVAIIIICIAVGIVVLVVTIACLSWLKRKRAYIKQKEEYFQRNGGLLLQRKLSSGRRDEEVARLFTENELKAATANFDERQVLGSGGNGKVYKGTLKDQRIVAIKRSVHVDQEHVDHFINEIKLLSNVIHRNVVKLLGCCLETKIPLLVYEYIPLGTLFEHIHEIGHSSFLPWQVRLRVATETAVAIAYLHAGLDRPIFHRDIKSANILLDGDFTAKVADFGASRFAPLNEHDEATMVLGTRGYLDPEYLQSGRLSDKSDVYSFGVVLAELLTGKRAIWYTQTGAQVLVVYFLNAIKEGRLQEILDAHVTRVGNVQQTVAVAVIARRCLERDPNNRPTMRQVAAELEVLRGSFSEQPRCGGEGDSRGAEVIDDIKDIGESGESVERWSAVAAEESYAVASPSSVMDLER